MYTHMSTQVSNDCLLQTCKYCLDCPYHMPEYGNGTKDPGCTEKHELVDLLCASRTGGRTSLLTG